MELIINPLGGKTDAWLSKLLPVPPYVTSLSSLEVGLNLLPDLPYLLVHLKFNTVCTVSPLTADHHTKSEVDAVPFFFIICHVFHTAICQTLY